MLRHKSFWREIWCQKYLKFLLQNFATTYTSFLIVTTCKILVIKLNFIIKTYILVTKIQVVTTGFVTNTNFFCSESDAKLLYST